MLLFTASDLASITSHIHNWVLFLLWLIPSFFLELFLHWNPVAYRAPTYLRSSSFSILSFFLFHTVHGVLMARILKWLAIPYPSGPHSVRPLHHDPSILGGPTQHGLISLSETKLWYLWSDWPGFCEYDFSVSALWCSLTTPTILLGFLLPGYGVSLHRCSSKMQLLFLNLNKGYLLMAILSDLECGVALRGNQ